MVILLPLVQGLRLFNLDIIREYGTRDRYYVIDINYFPGKLSSFIGFISFASMKIQILCNFIVRSDPTNLFTSKAGCHCRVWKNARIWAHIHRLPLGLGTEQVQEENNLLETSLILIRSRSVLSRYSWIALEGEASSCSSFRQLTWLKDGRSDFVWILSFGFSHYLMLCSLTKTTSLQFGRCKYAFLTCIN